MLFTKDITVLTTHTESDPLVETLNIAKGILSFVSVLFPTGCHGMVHCQLYYHEHQIAPSTQGMTMIGDSTPVEWTEYYECYQPPFQIKIKAWGVSCSYPHTLTIRVAILPRTAVLATAIVDAMKNLLSSFMPKRIFTKGKGE